ncbi:hypothetical protein BC826DRAFT_193385 [Russula brevipes]|nr:hypothetical protein BC826DRAFT_193385 [Russula brevipes]
MANFRDPAVFASILSLLVKFWHVLGGLYIWEFVTTLDFEWSVIRGRRPYRWTIWIYSLTRLAALLSIVTLLIYLDSPFACQIFGYLAFAAASLLILLRVIAIWNRDKIIMTIAVGVWGINAVLLIQSAARIRSSWNPALDTCFLRNVQTIKLNFISILITDIVLLLVMLIGLLRLRLDGGGMLSLGRVLWRQGVVWLFFATVAEVPPVVLFSLDLDDALSTASLLTALIIISIAATRMYRSLADFAQGSTYIVQDSLRGGNYPGSNALQMPVGYRASNKTEVVVHTAHVQYPTTDTSRDATVDEPGHGHCGSSTSISISDEDLERGAEI